MKKGDRHHRSQSPFFFLRKGGLYTSVHKIKPQLSPPSLSLLLIAGFDWTRG
jgi:hypothetical protein